MLALNRQFRSDRSVGDKQFVLLHRVFCLNTYETQPWSASILTDPFAPLRQRFLARCAAQLAELKAARHRGPSPRSNASLIPTAHSLAGAAGTFGFAEISVRASELERLLNEQADDGAAHTALDALITEIEQTLK